MNGDVRQTEMKTWITHWVARELEISPTRVREDAHLRGLGMGSLQAVDLAAELEQEFSCEIDPITVLEHPTVGALADHLSAAESVQYSA